MSPFANAMSNDFTLYAPPIQLLTAIWNLWQSLAAEGTARLREECGLELKEFIAVSYLQAKPAYPAWLADEMQMPRYEVSRLLGNLEQKGFVQRTRDPADGRQVLVALTPDGLSAWQTGLRTTERITRPYLAGLGEQELRDLIRTLTNLAMTHKENP